MMRPEEFVKAAVEACEKMVADGWTICHATYGNLEMKMCCPLTAFAFQHAEDGDELKDTENPKRPNVDVVSAILTKHGIRAEGFNAVDTDFFDGFDLPESACARNNSWVDAGVKVREILEYENIEVVKDDT